MKHLQPLAALACVVALFALSFTTTAGCVGPQNAITEAAQFPPAALAWPAVENDYLRGLDDGVAKDDLTTEAADGLRSAGDKLEAALDAEDLDALRLVPWKLTMEPWAVRGIADKLGDGEVGPTVAAELTEQLHQFTATVTSLQSLTP